ncbi:MAG: glycosyltransferase family 39 protein [Armatimonadota bacterium]|nr:glycosyltransferase family 39 protein [Armatimonadota bacterium]
MPRAGGYSFHPDEIFQIAASINIDFLHGQLNPHFYNYGAMYMYLVSLITTVASGFGFVDPSSLADRYLSARLLTAFLGAAIPYFVYLAASRLYTKSLALIAAAFAAITPIAVVHSHFATVDIVATFWVSICLAASAAIFTRPSTKQYVIAGLMAGFAGATKYGAAIVIIAPLAAHITSSTQVPIKRKITYIALLITTAAAGFIIGNPGSILWPDEFLRGLMFEYQHASQGHGFVFTQTGTGWRFHLTSSLYFGLGLPFLILALTGFAAMIFDGSRRGWTLAVFAAIYYLIIGFATVRFARYTIPLVPVISIAAAVAVTRVYAFISRRPPLGRGLTPSPNTQHPTPLSACWLILCLAAIYYTLSYSIALDRLFVVEDPRNKAAAWIERNVPIGSTIAFPTIAWFYSPALSPGFTHYQPGKREAAMAGVKSYDLLTDADVPWDWTIFHVVFPKYIIISDYEDTDALRARDTDAIKYMRMLRVQYTPAKTFSRRLHGGGLDFGKAESLPHDLKYASPRITIYKRRT